MEGVKVHSDIFLGGGGCSGEDCERPQERVKHINEEELRGGT